MGTFLRSVCGCVCVCLPPPASCRRCPALLVAIAGSLVVSVPAPRCWCRRVVDDLVVVAVDVASTGEGDYQDGACPGTIWAFRALSGQIV